MILLCVGASEYPFDRLLRIVDELCAEGFFDGSEIIAQIGRTQYRPAHYTAFSLIGRDEFQTYLKKADLIITHAGTGSVIPALKLGKKVIVFPRMERYGEHLDDHQLELAQTFTDAGYTLGARNKKELKKAVLAAETFRPAPFQSNKHAMNQLILEFIEGMKEAAGKSAECETDSAEKLKAKRLRVITVGNSPRVKGGITSVISQIRRYDWEQQNIDMEFISTYDGGSALHKMIYFTEGCLQLLIELLTNKPDVLHIHMSHAGSFTRKYSIHLLCKAFHVPDIIHLHSSSFMDFYTQADAHKKKQIRELLTDCSCVVALGDEWEQRVKSIAPQAHTRIMSNTIAIPKYTANQSAQTLSFLYLGVLVERKGVIDLLEAVCQLREEGFFEGKRVVFKIGGTGDCEEQLKSYVQEHQLQGLVQFLGWVAGKDKDRQLLTSQVLVLPSYNEGLPIAVLEAMSYGLPVLATDVGDVARAVRDQENGYLFTPGDIQSLRERIRTLTQDADTRRQMAQASRRIAEECFDEQNYFSDLADLYHEVCGDRRS